MPFATLEPGIRRLYTPHGMQMGMTEQSEVPHSASERIASGLASAGSPTQVAFRLITWIVKLNPFLRYALVPLAVAAGVFVVTKALGVTQAATFVASAIVAGFTVFFFLTSKVVAAGTAQLRGPITVLIWFFTIIFMLVVVTTFLGVGLVLAKGYIWPSLGAAPTPPLAPVPSSQLIPARSEPAPEKRALPIECAANACSNEACGEALAIVYRPLKAVPLVVPSSDVAASAHMPLECLSCGGCTVLVKPLKGGSAAPAQCCYRYEDGTPAPKCTPLKRTAYSREAFAGSADLCPAGVCVCRRAP